MASVKRPRDPCTENNFKQLLECLWSFPKYDARPHRHSVSDCAAVDCALERLPRLESFYKFYQQLSLIYETEETPGSTPAVRFHEDLHDIIRLIRNNVDLTRRQFVERCLTNHPAGAPSVTDEDRDRAIDLAVRAMTMINCQHQNLSLGLVESGIADSKWSCNTTIAQFIESCFRTPLRQTSLDKNDADSGKELVKSNLTAALLARRAKIRFKPTNDLRRHLYFDRKLRVVEIFHHAAFLKENLRLTKSQARQVTTAEQIKIGAVPRQIALEILDSIQMVLFRLSDSKSRAMLHSLVSREDFDPECLHFEFDDIRLPAEANIQYRYFGPRLAELHEEMERPTPDGLIERWLERKSGARYVMLATLIGVLCAVFIGILSLTATVYQTYVAYQAWQHPVGRQV